MSNMNRNDKVAPDTGERTRPTTRSTEQTSKQDDASRSDAGRRMPHRNDALAVAWWPLDRLLPVNRHSIGPDSISMKLLGGLPIKQIFRRTGHSRKLAPSGYWRRENGRVFGRVGSRPIFPSWTNKGRRAATTGPHCGGGCKPEASPGITTRCQ